MSSRSMFASLHASCLCHKVWDSTGASWGPFFFSSTALTSLPLPSGTAWVCTHMPTTPNCISILSQRWSTTRCSDWWWAWKRSVNGWMLIDWGYLAWNTAPVVRGSMPEDLTQGRWHPDFDRGYVFGCPTRQQAEFCTTRPTALWKVLLPYDSWSLFADH